MGDRRAKLVVRPRDLLAPCRRRRRGRAPTPATPPSPPHPLTHNPRSPASSASSAQVSTRPSSSPCRSPMPVASTRRSAGCAKRPRRAPLRPRAAPRGQQQQNKQRRHQTSLRPGLGARACGAASTRRPSRPSLDESACKKTKRKSLVSSPVAVPRRCLLLVERLGNRAQPRHARVLARALPSTLPPLKRP